MAENQRTIRSQLTYEQNRRRTALSRYDGKRINIVATVGRSRLVQPRTYSVCLEEVTFENGQPISDHCWVLVKSNLHAELVKGSRILFAADVRHYGYKGRFRYGLNGITKVTVLDEDGTKLS